eukprot:1604119-Pyramimonas_sp.AAC.1
MMRRAASQGACSMRYGDWGSGGWRTGSHEDPPPTPPPGLVPEKKKVGGGREGGASHRPGGCPESTRYLVLARFQPSQIQK